MMSAMPSSSLDFRNVNSLWGSVLVETLAREGMTMLIVTHEMGFAFKVSDRVVFMEGGRVLLDAPPAEVLASADPRVKDFLSHVHVS